MKYIFEKQNAKSNCWQGICNKTSLHGVSPSSENPFPRHQRGYGARAVQ